MISVDWMKNRRRMKRGHLEVLHARGFAVLQLTCCCDSDSVSNFPLLLLPSPTSSLHLTRPVTFATPIQFETAFLALQSSPDLTQTLHLSETELHSPCYWKNSSGGVAEEAMLYVVGLGLGDEKDITVRGLEAVRRCDKVYLEAYTSLLALGLGPDATATLEKLYGRPVIVADRELVEQGAEGILEEARTLNVAFLVVGDPFGATTHSDLLVRAKTLGIEVEVVHNASIMNAVGACGLQLYRFGEAISIPFFTDTWRPDSFYDKIKANRTIGLHTLCLLDIRVKEQSVEALCRGKKEYEPPRYMSINTAIEQLLEVEESRAEKVYSEDTLCVGLARLGTSTQKIVAGSMKELLHVDFGLPLHSLVIAGTTHVMEEEFLSFYKPS